MDKAAAGVAGNKGGATGVSSWGSTVNKSFYASQAGGSYVLPVTIYTCYSV